MGGPKARMPSLTGVSVDTNKSHWHKAYWTLPDFFMKRTLEYQQQKTNDWAKGGEIYWHDEEDEISYLLEKLRYKTLKDLEIQLKELMDEVKVI